MCGFSVHLCDINKGVDTKTNRASWKTWKTMCRYVLFLSCLSWTQSVMRNACSLLCLCHPATDSSNLARRGLCPLHAASPFFLPKISAFCAAACPGSSYGILSVHWWFFLLHGSSRSTQTVTCQNSFLKISYDALLHPNPTFSLSVCWWTVSTFCWNSENDLEISCEYKQTNICPFFHIQRITSDLCANSKALRNCCSVGHMTALFCITASNA